MKEITIEKIIKIPTADEIETVAKNQSPIEPKQIILITCFVMGYEFENSGNRAVYECMEEADEFDRNRIASDVAIAYCERNNIKWGSLRIINISKNNKHYVIEALVIPRE